MPLEVHEPTVKLMREHYAKSGKEVNEARLRMATLPKGAQVCATMHNSVRMSMVQCPALA